MPQILLFNKKVILKMSFYVIIPSFKTILLTLLYKESTYIAPNNLCACPGVNSKSGKSVLKSKLLHCLLSALLISF
jgi:hypothetical protein